MALFDQDSLGKIEQLILVANKVRIGLMKGERRSRKRGSSIEFADYRDYVHGDDLRRLDWNIFARLEKPFIKLLEEEEDLSVHILVDTSASMDWPSSDSPYHKLRYCLRTAGALGYIGLGMGDQVSLALLSSAESERWGPYRGRQNGIRLFRFLDASGSGGTTDLSSSMRSYSERSTRPGLLFLISDLLSPSGYEAGMTSLLSQGYEIVIIHVLAPDEVEPPLGGDVKLVDIETKDDAEISLNISTINAYRNRLKAWQGEINDTCRRYNIHYVSVVTDYPWEKLILRSLRKEGVVK